MSHVQLGCSCQLQVPQPTHLVIKAGHQRLQLCMGCPPFCLTLHHTNLRFERGCSSLVDVVRTIDDLPDPLVPICKSLPHVYGSTLHGSWNDQALAHAALDRAAWQSTAVSQLHHGNLCHIGCIVLSRMVSALSMQRSTLYVWRLRPCKDGCWVFAVAQATRRWQEMRRVT